MSNKKRGFRCTPERFIEVMWTAKGWPEVLRLTGIRSVQCARNRAQMYRRMGVNLPYFDDHKEMPLVHDWPALRRLADELAATKIRTQTPNPHGSKPRVNENQ
jgi:hypothetical protein